MMYQNRSYCVYEREFTSCHSSFEDKLFGFWYSIKRHVAFMLLCRVFIYIVGFHTPDW